MYPHMIPWLAFLYKSKMIFLEHPTLEGLIFYSLPKYKIFLVITGVLAGQTAGPCSEDCWFLSTAGNSLPVMGQAWGSPSI